MLLWPAALYCRCGLGLLLVVIKMYLYFRSNMWQVCSFFLVFYARIAAYSASEVLCHDYVVCL